jgi:hypothetical protein
LPAKSLQELGLDAQRIMQPMSPGKRHAYKHRSQNRYFHKAMSSAGIGNPSPISPISLGGGRSSARPGGQNCGNMN